jgi:hypothetical protein
LVRLLNPFDPYLQARDRDLIVPDEAVQKTLWPILGRPGVVLVDGEVAGTWRPRSSDSALTLAIAAFHTFSKATWAKVEEEASRVGAVRGVNTVRITST